MNWILLKHLGLRIMGMICEVSRKDVDMLANDKITRLDVLKILM